MHIYILIVPILLVQVTGCLNIIIERNHNIQMTVDMWYMTYDNMWQEIATTVNRNGHEQPEMWFLKSMVPPLNLTASPVHKGCVVKCRPWVSKQKLGLETSDSWQCRKSWWSVGYLEIKHNMSESICFLHQASGFNLLLFTSVCSSFQWNTLNLKLVGLRIRKKEQHDSYTPQHWDIGWYGPWKSWNSEDTLF